MFIPICFYAWIKSSYYVDKTKYLPFDSQIFIQILIWCPGRLHTASEYTQWPWFQTLKEWTMQFKSHGDEVTHHNNISSHLLLSEWVRVGSDHWPVWRAHAILVQISYDPDHRNEEEGHQLWEVTYMSHWDTCCLYKVTEIISTFSLVQSQCIFKVLFQGVEASLWLYQYYTECALQKQV